jgi:glycine oxidase
MAKADSRAKAAGQPAPDLLVVGGGIMGLWTALIGARSGLSVHLLERRRIGAGASGGVLGALMPHLPDRWNDKKAFQFAALASLEAEIAALEAETGLSAGYRRSGRIIPLPKPHLREIALGHARDAQVAWRSGDRHFPFAVVDTAFAEGWPAADVMAHGLVHDGLAARVSPRNLMAVLRHALDSMPKVTIEEGCGLSALDLATGTALLDDGGSIGYGHCVLAAGVETFPFLSGIGVPLARPAGVAVKGQATLLRAKVDPALPVVFLDGLYVVPHEDGLVAVGSTSENTFSDPHGTDAQLEALLGRARAVVPMIDGAEVVERWAGLRPKAIGRDPMVGRHPEHERFSLMTGGFKVSFGIAHALAGAVVAQMKDGTPLDAPSSFGVEAHMLEARRA